VCDLLLPMFIGVKMWISNGISWNMARCTMSHCILDMHKLSYSDSFAQNTHDTSTFSLSLVGAECVWLPVGWWKGLASPLPLLLYTERRLNLLKKKKIIYGSQSYKEPQKVFLSKEYALCLTDCLALLWSFRHITKMTLV
jgi:hypothetical protein